MCFENVCFAHRSITRPLGTTTTTTTTITTTTIIITTTNICLGGALLLKASAQIKKGMPQARRHACRHLVSGFKCFCKRRHTWLGHHFACARTHTHSIEVLVRLCVESGSFPCLMGGSGCDDRPDGAGGIPGHSDKGCGPPQGVGDISTALPRLRLYTCSRHTGATGALGNRNAPRTPAALSMLFTYRAAGQGKVV